MTPVDGLLVTLMKKTFIFVDESL